MKNKIKNAYEMYAYNPLTDGVYYMNGVPYRYGEDFRNVERYKEYLDCGFTMLQVRYENAYSGEEWETSNTKLVCDRAYAAGVRKLLISDNRIDQLIEELDIIGEGKRFNNEAELDETLREWVAPYKDVPGFYGIQVLDEPEWKEMTAYGHVVRSLKRILPNAYLQCNINSFHPAIPGVDDYYEAYRRYVDRFFEETQLDHICFDEYPFRKEYIISGNVLRGYPILVEKCKKYGAELHSIMQSIAWVKGGKVICRPVNESDMYWQTNVGIGFGVTEFSWYTYMPKAGFRYDTGRGDGVNGASFLNHDGSKTNLFHYTKRIMAEMQEFAPIALQYKYDNAYIITEAGKTMADFDWTKLSTLNQECPFPVRIDKGVALVTEQRNGDDKLIMIENLSNVKDELFDNASPAKLEFELPEGEKTFYFRGKKIEVEQINGVFYREMKVGDAIFVEIKQL